MNIDSNGIIRWIEALKGAQSYLFSIFSNFWRFWYYKDAHIFLITPVKFNSWNMLRLEAINENVHHYGNHIKLTQ